MSIRSKIGSYIVNYREKKYLTSIRKKNRNKNPTIVCNNCIAGIIYSNLGLRFNSPTINLSIRGEDYLEFVKNFKYYSECELAEVEDATFNYPVGRLIAKDAKHRDIYIHFQHYSCFEKAKEKWIERYGRVEWDNIFYIWEFYDTLYDSKFMYAFDELPLKNKIILTHRKYEDLKNAFEITCYQDDKPVGQIINYDGLTGKRFLEQFDYVRFLNAD